MSQRNIGQAPISLPTCLAQSDMHWQRSPIVFVSNHLTLGGGAPPRQCTLEEVAHFRGLAKQLLEQGAGEEGNPDAPTSRLTSTEALDVPEAPASPASPTLASSAP